LNKENKDKSFSKYLVTENNAERLSRTLCKMRGAALKLGQILRYKTYLKIKFIVHLKML